MTWGTAQDPHRFRQWGSCRGRVLGGVVARRQCLRCLSRLASGHGAAEGARVALVEAVAVLRVVW